jgi:hypothetical protein
VRADYLRCHYAPSGHPPRFGMTGSWSGGYPAVALRAPLQKLNSVQTSAGPVKVDRKRKNATM